MIASLPNLLEGLAFSGLVALYIWRLQDASPKTWLLFPVWLVISFALHCESPKSLGWRADNLKAATQRAAPVFLFFMLIIVIAGIFLGALHRLPAHFVEPKRFIGYFAFCLLQQVGLQSITLCLQSSASSAKSSFLWWKDARSRSIRRNRQRLPSSFLIENASRDVPDSRRLFCPRHFRSKPATIRELRRLS